ncbi:MAG: IPT/TIG domain-containing protein, partial [Flavobacterium sp.]
MKRILLAVTSLFLYFAAFAQVPTITSFSPASGPAGTPVTISGSNFSTTTTANTVF